MNVWWSAQLFLMLQQYAVLLGEPAAAAGLRLSWHITFREPSVTDGNNREDVHVRKDKEAEEIIEFEEVPDKRQKCISTDWCAARGRRWIKVQLVASTRSKWLWAVCTTMKSTSLLLPLVKKSLPQCESCGTSPPLRCKPSLGHPRQVKEP